MQPGDDLLGPRKPKLLSAARLETDRDVRVKKLASSRKAMLDTPLDDRARVFWQTVELLTTKWDYRVWFLRPQLETHVPALVCPDRDWAKFLARNYGHVIRQAANAAGLMSLSIRAEKKSEESC